MHDLQHFIARSRKVSSNLDRPEKDLAIMVTGCNRMIAMAYAGIDGTVV
jgi:hypothetical protein